MKIAGQCLFAAVFLLAACLPAAAAQAKSPGKRLAAIPRQKPDGLLSRAGRAEFLRPGLRSMDRRRRRYRSRHSRAHARFPPAPGRQSRQASDLFQFARRDHHGIHCHGPTDARARDDRPGGPHHPAGLRRGTQTVRQRQALRPAADSAADQHLLAMQLSLRLCHRRRTPARDRAGGASRHPRSQDCACRLPAEGHAHTSGTACTIQGARISS